MLTISDETQEFMLQQKVHDSATTFTTFLFGFSIWMILYALWEFLGRPIASDFLTHGIEVLSVIMLIFILHRTSLTWRDLGCLPENPKKTVKTGVIVALAAGGLFFAALHIHFGFVFMIGAAILAGLEGILYEKQQNIVGVWIVHWAFGVCATLLCLIDH